MKAITSIILFAALFMLVSCSKDKSNATVRYEFTAGTAATYTIKYSVNNNTEASETITGTTWTKTVSTATAGGTNPTVARLTVFPPSTWAGTGNTSTVTLKIFVNNTESASSTKTLSASDLSGGVFVIASF